MEEKKNQEITLRQKQDSQEDSLQFLKTGLFDVTLEVHGTEFRVHKTMLSKGSATFEAIFKRAREDGINRDRITISYFDANIMEQILKYIYLGELKSNEEITLDLLIAANMYALKNLETLCKTLMERDITLDMAIQTLIIADRHNAKALKVRALNLIKAKIADIVHKDCWLTLNKSYSHLVAELIHFNTN